MLRAESPTLRARLLKQREVSDWRLSLVLLASIAVLLVGYRDVIRGQQWMFTTLLVAGLVLAACSVLRALGAPLSWVGGIIVWLMAIVWVFVPGTLMVIFPTPSSIGALHKLWVDAQAIMGAELPPVTPAKSVVYVIAGCFGALAVLLDVLVFTLRKPVIVGAVFIGVYVFPTAASGDKPNPLIFVGVAALWLCLVRAQMRHTRGFVGPGRLRRGGPSVAIALAALALSVALPPVLPRVANVAVSWGTPPPGPFDRGINPILQLGQNLRRNSPVTALHLTTTAANAPYLKVATLLDFNGNAWSPSSEVKYGPIEGNVSLYPDVARTPITTKITIEHLNSPRLPVPYPAMEFSGLNGTWEWEAQGLTLRSDTDTSSNQTYTVTSLEVRPTLTQMRRATTDPGPVFQRYLALPDKMPASIAKTARQVTAGKVFNYDKAIALQAYFRSGNFSYSATAPVADGYDGTGVDVIAKFLAVRRGYCVHFASAMAVMARTLGIPARIAVGYAPGVQVGTSKTGDPIYEDTSADLHAWPELYFEGVGWVAFEPTPGVGFANDVSAGVSGSEVTRNPSAARARGNVPSQRNSRNLLGNTSVPVTDTTSASRSADVVLAGLVLIMLLPFSIRRGQRFLRVREAGRTASRLWRELEVTARDHSIFVTASETPRAFAAQLRAWPGMDDAALTGLLASVERERFGPPGTPTDAMKDFRVVMRCLRTGATIPQRLRAIFLPRSLFGQTTRAPRPVPVEPNLA